MKRFVLIVLGIALLADGIAANVALGEIVVNSVTINGFELQVIQQADPWAGLQSFRVKVTTDVGILNTLSFTEPAIDGDVHQCQYVENGTPQSTLLLEEIIDGENGSPSWTAGGWGTVDTACDTHILMWDGVNTNVAFGVDPLVEVNDGTNPYGLDTHNGNIKIGLGQMTGGSDYLVLLTGGAERVELDLMQVVIPEGTTVYFNGKVLKATGPDYTDIQSATFEDIAIHSVPEPGALLLLGAGIASLLGISWRRKQ